jgi:hypothetical protein
MGYFEYMMLRMLHITVRVEFLLMKTDVPQQKLVDIGEESR